MKHVFLTLLLLAVLVNAVTAQSGHKLKNTSGTAKTVEEPTKDDMKTAFLAGDYAAAIQLADKRLIILPGDKTALTVKALCYAVGRKRDLTLRIANELYPNDDMAGIFLATLSFTLSGKIPQADAIWYMKEAHLLNPVSPLVYMMEASQLLDYNLYDQSKTAALTASALLSTDDDFGFRRRRGANAPHTSTVQAEATEMMNMLIQAGQREDTLSILPDYKVLLRNGKYIASLKAINRLLRWRSGNSSAAHNAAIQDKDTTLRDFDNPLQAFRHGTVHGNARYYFMTTINEGALTDYFANAAGGLLSYETAMSHHFSIGAGAGFAFNLWSSDLSVPDAATGQNNRYEISLFDIQNPGNKTDMVRLEELYLKYTLKIGTIRFGKLGALNTPFINPQDSRVRPTVEEGLYAHLDPRKNMTVEGGWLYGISPRSTYKWFRAGESIGIYSQGINPDGSKSDYLGHTSAAGIGLLGITYLPIRSVKLQLWEQYADNIFNTLFLQGEFTARLREQTGLLTGFQVIKQDGIGNGGNDNPKLAFYTKNASAWVLSGRLGYTDKNWETSINYTRITKAGRYLMPREWGRDPFYTFMPRERNEGYGDVNAFMAKAAYKMLYGKLRTELAVGFYDLPDVNNYAMNKYGLPSYDQLNLDFKYAFSRFLKGLDAELLYVYKADAGNTHNNDKYVINKVNMSQLNIVFNYRF